MSNIFTQVELSKVPTNDFNLNHDFKLSLDMGKLIPISVMECIPGDHIRGQSTVMLRMMPMLAPIMHRVNVDIHYFFCPNRLVWPGWEKFIVSGVPNEDTPAHPYFNNVPVPESSLADYMGLPLTPGPQGIDKVGALAWAQYNKIFNDYYRDQNLQQGGLEEVLQDGLNDYTKFQVIQNRAWQHDYFTSALPFAQKGDAVQLPIGNFNDVDVTLKRNNQPGMWGKADASLMPAGTFTTLQVKLATPGQTQFVPTTTTALPQEGVVYNPNGTLVAETSQLTADAVTINALRWAVRLQEFLERNARGGTRYIENIMAHFNVKSSDKRLQRPEFIGGSSQPVVISEVLQNAPATETQDTPQGNMAGHGLSVGQGKNVNYYVEEHGFFFAIMSVRPTTSYQQGVPRQFSKFDPLQYAWPTFANVGEQAILNREIYYSISDGKNDETFGYIPRYAEYKYQPSRVAGAMQTSLSFWHMGRIFQTRPGLNKDFITSNPTKRIFAVDSPNVDTLVAQIIHSFRFRRKLPRFGIPTL